MGGPKFFIMKDEFIYNHQKNLIYRKREVFSDEEIEELKLEEERQIIWWEENKKKNKQKRENDE